MYFLTFLKARHQKWSHRAQVKVSAGWSLIEALGQNLFPCLFHLLAAAYIPWLLAAASDPPASLL